MNRATTITTWILSTLLTAVQAEPIAPSSVKVLDGDTIKSTTALTG